MLVFLVLPRVSLRHSPSSLSVWSYTGREEPARTLYCLSPVCFFSVPSLIPGKFCVCPLEGGEQLIFTWDHCGGLLGVLRWLPLPKGTLSLPKRHTLP